MAPNYIKLNNHANRATRVARMLKKNNKTNTRKKLTRQLGSRFLVPKAKKTVRISNTQNVFGTNFENLNETTNNQYIQNVIKSRQSIQSERPRYSNVQLSEKEAKIAANISAMHNSYTNAMNAIWDREYGSLPSEFKNLPPLSKEKIMKHLHFLYH